MFIVYKWQNFYIQVLWKTALRGRNESFVCEGIKLKKQYNYLKQKRPQCPQSAAGKQSLMSEGLWRSVSRWGLMETPLWTVKRSYTSGRILPEDL